jgi:hypothetical protein
MTTAFGQGIILWDESLNGPLANDYTQATGLGALQNSTNSIIGASQLIGDGIYGDYFSFTIPTGRRISAMWLSVDNPVAVWIGDPAFANQFGYVVNPANGDVLPQWGFNPIGDGTYGMYIMNYDLASNPSVSNYRLDFFIQAVPEPTTLSLALVGLGVLGWARRKRGH